MQNDCLKTALQSAVHHLEEIRMKAIRLKHDLFVPVFSIYKDASSPVKQVIDACNTCFAQRQTFAQQAESTGTITISILPSLFFRSSKFHSQCFSCSDFILEIHSRLVSEQERCLRYTYGRYAVIGGQWQAVAPEECAIKKPDIVVVKADVVDEEVKC
ncbi:unnamed protein product [Thlaspi arvense]|uniref:Symplekin C-terminal domain-containing protein n=1 Tax=Thlaspi arvense TaxID=13288 RepID=A0AAU9SZJ5_THLAR|nr:unnamed protein product [Thlaspi arvense]